MEQQARPSVCSQSGDQSKVEVSQGAGLHDESSANQLRQHCTVELMVGGQETSLEELRAETYRQKEAEEKMRRVTEQQEEKRRLLPSKAQQVTPSDQLAAALPFKVFDESRCGPAEHAGAGSDELPDDVFLRPGEKGLCVKVQLPLRRQARHEQNPEQNPEQNQHTDALPRTSEEFWEEPRSESKAAGPKVLPRIGEKLSPIQEMSVEAASLNSLGEVSVTSTPLEQQRLDGRPAPAGDPCDPEVRRQLLEVCDITSSPHLHSHQRSLPAVEEGSLLDLGGDTFLVMGRHVDRGSFSIFKGFKQSAETTECIFMKVDSCSAPWDFYLFHRLRKSLPSADGLPVINCFLFVDGCITVYTPPALHLFTDVADCDVSDVCVGPKAVSLLQLVLQLHSCQLLHAGLHPAVLCSCSGGSEDRLFPVDWSSSLDLGLQEDVTCVQQLQSAQAYIRLGLLEPSDPPHMVDLVGVAESVYFLLTDTEMVPVKDDSGWTVEPYSGDEPCDIYTMTWRRFFRYLLNPGHRSSVSLLSDLKEELSSLYL